MQSHLQDGSKRTPPLVPILMLGVFGLLNTEMGVIGILPMIAERYGVSISTAGWVVSSFALAVAVSGPVLPLLLSRINRKHLMLFVLGLFVAGNLVSAFTSNFAVLLIARIVPALFHPVYCSMAFSVAAESVPREESSRAVAKVFVGVSAGMVLGVPLSSLIANTASLAYAMLFFAAVTAVAFVATLRFVPSMPVSGRLSGAAQLHVLKRSVIWLSLAAVIGINGALFGLYSYLAEYLELVTRYDWRTISVMLFVYGLSNIAGNLLAGRLLTGNPRRLSRIYPLALSGVYTLMLLFGQSGVVMAVLLVLWGMLGGLGGNLMQYWIVSAAPEAPEFANGLFLTSANLGTTFGTSICGLLLAGMDTRYVVLGGLLFVAFGMTANGLRMAQNERGAAFPFSKKIG
ncbi:MULTISPECIES: MFS transporter [Saccharibacillus]|uniref:MFS transporter n=1 Tax=Saccharibacillus TaxID=456492 RepID=UPI0012397C73|nr:MFS transporter [Saccharibacillus sp. WB 17]MWJ30530.1 MFS transporter [Saccharibacillus sp. WB 17]